ncbi:hypothetical protein [uncultured Mediterranean phage uvDeep-CGR2-KM21-C345]|nr:hypothetical protein [uncultured Mediterranean phage uvDeep-CGR2-KM21-C345]
MANALTTSFSHTYAGKELLTEIFYAPSVESGQNPFELHRIMSDVKTKTNIYKVGALTNIIQGDSGCGFSASGSVAITDKVIDPQKLKVNIEQCEDAFSQTIFAEAQKSGVDRADIQGTIIEEMVMTAVTRGMRDDLIKAAWFSDAASSHAMYGNFEGFFERILGGSGYLLDLNSDATYEASDALATDGAYKAMKNLYENMPAAMRSIKGQLVAYVTSSVYDNLLSTLEAAGTDSGLQRILDGVSQLSFRGIPVQDMSLWDASLADTSANPNSAAIGSNAIVITTPDNLVVGTDITDPMAELSVWYEKKDEKFYLSSKFLFGTQVVFDELVAAAY